MADDFQVETLATLAQILPSSTSSQKASLAHLQALLLQRTKSACVLSRLNQDLARFRRKLEGQAALVVEAAWDKCDGDKEKRFWATVGLEPPQVGISKSSRTTPENPLSGTHGPESLRSRHCSGHAESKTRVGSPIGSADLDRTSSRTTGAAESLPPTSGPRAIPKRVPSNKPVPIFSDRTKSRSLDERAKHWARLHNDGVGHWEKAWSLAMDGAKSWELWQQPGPNPGLTQSASRDPPKPTRPPPSFLDGLSKSSRQLAFDLLGKLAGDLPSLAEYIVKSGPDGWKNLISVRGENVKDEGTGPERFGRPPSTSARVASSALLSFPFSSTSTPPPPSRPSSSTPDGHHEAELSGYEDGKSVLAIVMEFILLSVGPEDLFRFVCHVIEGCLDRARAEPNLHAPSRAEVDSFVLEMMDLVEAMNVGVTSSSGPTVPEDGSETGSGPLSMDRAMEDVILRLLQDFRVLKVHERARRRSREASSTTGKVFTAPEEPTSWSDSSANVFSSVVSGITGGINEIGLGITKGVSVVGSTIPGSKFFLPNATPLGSPPTLSSAGTEGVAKSGSTKVSMSEPIPIDRPDSSREAASEMDQLLSTGAAEILGMLGRPLSPNARTPLPLAICRFFLSEHPDSHLTNLFVIRWWAFTWLGRTIRSLGRGCAMGGSPSARQTVLFSTLGEAGGHAVDVEIGRQNGLDDRGLLNEVWISSHEAGEMFQGIYKRMYDGIAKECRIRSEGGSVDSSSPHDPVRLSARGVLSIFGLGSPSKKPTTPPPVQYSAVIRALNIPVSEFFLLLQTASRMLESATPRRVNEDTPPSSTTSPKSEFGMSSGVPGSTRDHSGVHCLLQAIRVQSGNPTRGASSTATNWHRQSVLAFAVVHPSGVVSFGDTLPTPEPGSFPQQPQPRSEVRSSNLPAVGSLPIPPHSSAIPFARGSVASEGWSTPPQSPGYVALKAHSGISAGYFDIPGHIDMSSATEAETKAPPWVATSPSSRPLMDFPSGMQHYLVGKNLPSKSLTSTELDIVRRGLFSLLETIDVNDGQPLANLSDRFNCAAIVSKGAKLYHQDLLFCQCAAILRPLGPSDLVSLLQTIASPIRAAIHKRKVKLAQIQESLAQLHSQTLKVTEVARRHMAAIFELRIRVWFAQDMEGGKVGAEVRSRLSDILSDARKSEERVKAEKRTKEWRTDLGIHDFLRDSNEDSHEAFMLVDSAVAHSMDSERFFGSLIWAREAVVFRQLVSPQTERTDTNPLRQISQSMANTLVNSGSLIFSTQGGLSAPSFGTSTLSSDSNATRNPRSDGYEMPDPNQILLYFGASTKSLSSEGEIVRLTEAALEEFLLRVQVRAAGYLVGSLQTWGLCLGLDISGNHIGADAWFPHALPSKTIPGLPGINFSDEFEEKNVYAELLERFRLHPSPHQKMRALYELELILASQITCPTFRVTTSSSTLPPVSLSSLPDLDANMIPRPKNYFQRLSRIFGRRVTLESAEALNHLEPANHKSPGSVARRGWRKQQSMDTWESLHPFLTEQGHPTPTDLDFGTPKGLASTDSLLSRLEAILMDPTLRPKQIFFHLQLIASLVPSCIIDFRDEGKSFWDVALSALSLRRDALEEMIQEVIAGLGGAGEDTRGLAWEVFEVANKEAGSRADRILQALKDTEDNPA